MAAIRARVWETEAYWLRRIGGYLSGEISPGQALPARAVFVAEDNGAVVGFVAGHRTQRHKCKGELEWIDVISECRGRGIAGRLLNTIADWFVSQNALRVCVDVAPQNAIARGLYAKHGAVPLNPHWMVWEDVRVIGGS
jgi:GNAT superfamily N-acetyltransferase